MHYYDHVPASPPPERTGRLVTVALFVGAFLFGLLVGVPL